MARLRPIVMVTAAIFTCLMSFVAADGAQAAMPRPGAVYPVTFTLPRTARPPVRPVPVPVPVPAVPPGPRSVPPAASKATGPLAGCERELESTAGQRGVPRMAVAGASFTAGTGPGRAGQSWAVLLARLLHWNAVVYGVPGAGYVRPGAGHRGPMAALLGRIGLGTLTPQLVIVQAGHDDVGVPPQLERARVAQVIRLIRSQAPQARIALITVFPGRRRPAADYQADQVIVAAARAADPGVIVMDPLTQGWTFPRSRDGLHPTAAGDAWIAGKVADLLRGSGIQAAAARSPGGPVICDSGVPVGPRVAVPVRPQPR